MSAKFTFLESVSFISSTKTKTQFAIFSIVTLIQASENVGFQGILKKKNDFFCKYLHNGTTFKFSMEMKYLHNSYSKLHFYLYWQNHGRQNVNQS